MAPNRNQHSIGWELSRQSTLTRIYDLSDSEGEPSSIFRHVTPQN